MPLIAAAVVMMMVLTLTAAAAVVHLFRNDIIVSSADNIPVSSSENGAPGAVAITGSGGNPPAALDEMTESARFKSDDWDVGDSINGGVVSEYSQWDSAEAVTPLSAAAALVGRMAQKKWSIPPKTPQTFWTP